MDEITVGPSSWPLPSGEPPPRWEPGDITERNKRQHLAALNQQLLFAKAELNVDSFRSILSDIENIRYGLDPRYQKAPPEFVTSPAVTSAFSEDGRSNDDDNAAQGEHKNKWFRFSKISKFLRRLLFFRWSSRAKSVVQGVTYESRNDRT
jgi:hypothetical protein